MINNAFRKGIEARDIESAARALSPDVTFYSPVMVHPYRGREAVARLLGVLTEVFEGMRYTHELVGEAHEGKLPPAPTKRTQALVFEARLGQKPLQGLDLLTYGDDGLISDLTVMVRPLPAAMALARTVGARMEEIAQESPGDEQRAEVSTERI